MSVTTFFDLHCHPSLKPFAHSYRSCKNSTRYRRKRSIWHCRKPNFLSEFINEKLTLTPFTQSDFQTLINGNTRIVCASLSPLEKGFFVSRIGDGPLVDLIADWTTGIGLRKVNFVQRNKDYFSELVKEMDFYRQLHNKTVKIDRKENTYRLVRNFGEITANLAESEQVVSVIITIEGGHVFTGDNTRAPDEDQLMCNIDKVLDWEYKPLFLSPAHHFYNHLCGHAYSLSDTLQRFLDQDEGVNTGITALGMKMIRKLLDNRVLVDLKHMSRKARREFYTLHSEPSCNNIPIIVSHGCVNGHATVNSDIRYSADNGVFHGSDINFFDDEIVRVARSKGLFGLQLDERRIASSTELDKITDAIPEEEKLERYARFVWNQLLHIARVLDSAWENAWDCICIGSDYDGIVDPMNGYWTTAEFELLKSHTLRHIRNFQAMHGNAFQKEENNIPAVAIADKVFTKNALDFLSRDFR